MKDALLIKSETTYRDGITYIREIRAVGYMDDSGQFHMTQCVGSMYSEPVSDDNTSNSDRIIA